MKLIPCVQGSADWFNARVGIPTASNFDRIITPAKGKLAAAHVDYICELIAERYRDPHEPAPEAMVSRAMQNGIMQEPAARAWYAQANDIDVQQCGLCLTDDGRFGASPDGLVGDDGAIELKCPTAKVHVGYLLAGTLPDEYKPQVHGELIVTGRPWVDFLSYCDPLPAFCIRVRPDAFTAALRACLEEFWLKLTEASARIRAMA